MDTESSHLGTTVALSIPVTRPEIFSHSAAGDILSVLADNPETAYGMRELSRIIDTTHRTVSLAVDDLEAVDLVETGADGPKRLVQINSVRLSKPENPILTIPQQEFHTPIQDLVDELTDSLDDIRGIAIFGSVARGEAGRRSDIDCFVLVEENQATAQQTVHEIVETLHNRRYNGERYTFQVLVESVATATTYGNRLQEIFAHGITIRDSPQFQRLRDEVGVEVRADGQ